MQLGIENQVLTEDMISTADKYCRCVVLPWSELAYYEESAERRNRLHDKIAFYLDMDREFVTDALDKAFKPFSYSSIPSDGTLKNLDDYHHVLDGFLDELLNYASLPENKRHKFNEEVLEECVESLNDLSTMPELSDTTGIGRQ